MFYIHGNVKGKWSQNPLARESHQQSYLVSWCFEPTKNYIRAEHKLHSISQIIHFTTHHTTSHFFFQPIYVPRALNTGTCIQRGDLFYSAGLHRNHVLARANTGKIGRDFRKNAGRWTGTPTRNSLTKATRKTCTPYSQSLLAKENNQQGTP